METPSLSHMVKMYIHSQDEVEISFSSLFSLFCGCFFFFYFRKPKFQRKKNHIAPHWSMRNSNQLQSGSSMQYWECCNMSYFAHEALTKSTGLWGEVVRVHKLLWIVEVCDPELTNGPGQGEPSSWPTIGTFTILSNAS